MKKLILLALIAVVITGFAAAGGLVFQVGAGYHSSYYGDDLSGVTDVSAMPLGIGGYAGVGYGFGESKAFSIGGEFAPSWDFSVSPFGVSNFAWQARAFLKWKPAGLFTLTGFGGYVGNAVPSDWPDLSANNWSFGARATVLFLYFEWDVVMNNDLSSGILKQEIALGFAFFK